MQGQEVDKMKLTTIIILLAVMAGAACGASYEFGNGASLSYDSINNSVITDRTFIDLDGAADYAEINLTAVTNFSQDEVYNWTISLTVKKDINTTNYMPYIRYGLNAEEGQGFYIRTNPKNGTQFLAGKDASFSQLNSENESVGTWRTYTLVTNQTTMTAYIDGAYLGTTEADILNLSSTGTLYRLGYDAYFGAYLDGSIDDFSIMNKSYTPAEIQEIEGNLSIDYAMTETALTKTVYNLFYKDGVFYGNANSCLWKSVDNGNTWTVVKNYTGIYKGNRKTYVTDSGNIIYGLTNTGNISVSTDGVNFNMVTPFVCQNQSGQGYGDFWQITETANGTLFMGEYGATINATIANCSYIHKSDDNGLTWTIAYNSSQSGWPARHAHIIEYDPYTGYLYATQGDNTPASMLIRSMDNGTTWEQLENISNSQYTAIAITKDYRIFATDGGTNGIYRTEDDKTFERVYTYPANAQSYGWNSVTDNEGNIYFGSVSTASSTSYYLLMSPNNGTNWYVMKDNYAGGADHNGIESFAGFNGQYALMTDSGASPTTTYRVSVSKTSRSDLALWMNMGELSGDSILDLAHGHKGKLVSTTWNSSMSANITCQKNQQFYSVGASESWEVNCDASCYLPNYNYTPTTTAQATLCSGRYHLDDGIIIGANDIELDCNGAELRGVGKTNTTPFNIGLYFNLTMDSCNFINYTGQVLLSDNTTIKNSYIKGNITYFIGKKVSIVNTSLEFVIQQYHEAGIKLGVNAPFAFKIGDLNITNSILNSSNGNYWLFEKLVDVNSLYAYNSRFTNMNRPDISKSIVKGGNLTFINNTINNSRGIITEGKNFNISITFINNTIYNAQYGLSVILHNQLNSHLHVNDNIIHANPIINDFINSTDRKYGIYCEDVRNAEISGNIIYQSIDTMSIDIDPVSSAFNAINVTVNNNKVYSLLGGSGRLITISGQVQDMLIYSNYMEGYLNESAISLGDTYNNRVYNNTINITQQYASPIRGYAIELYNNGSNNTITENKIINAKYAFRIGQLENISNRVYNNQVMGGQFSIFSYWSNNTLFLENTYDSGSSNIILQNDRQEMIINESSTIGHYINFSNTAFLRLMGSWIKYINISNNSIQLKALPTYSTICPSNQSTCIKDFAGAQYNETIGAGNRTLILSRTQDNDPYATAIATGITVTDWTYTDASSLSISCTGTGNMNITNLDDMLDSSLYVEVRHDGSHVTYLTTANYTTDGCSDWDFYGVNEKQLSVISPIAATILQYLAGLMYAIAVLVVIIYPVWHKESASWPIEKWIFYFVTAIVALALAASLLERIGAL